ncbi:MAG: HAMP domain-containing protein [Clostridia bacterium]|nr:HAMP domain-containing protein [Clostridia bacterium]
MKRNSFFIKSLLLVYGTVAIFAVLIMAIYTAISPQLFARNKTEDLTAKGQIISGYIESTLRGEISSTYLVPLIGRSTSQWEATVWVVDTQGSTLIRTQQIDGRRVGRLPASLSKPMLPKVLTGEIATHIGSMEDLQESTLSYSSIISASAYRDVLGGLAPQDEDSAGSEEVISGSLVAVAVPIRFFGEVVGAVFMAQSMTEIMDGMQALTNTITFSLLLVALLLLPVALFFASRMSRPVERLRTAALTMAGGDRAVRADEQRRDEFGELGHALNFLSSELGATISSLELERSRLESLINGLSEGIIAIDADGTVTLVNPAVYDLLGLSGDITSIREALPEIFSMLDEALAANSHILRTHWHGKTALRVSVTPLLRSSAAPTGCVGILSDVTSAERLEQTRRDYVANVSHELRTPLTAMRGLIEPLRDGLIKTEEQRQQTYNVILRETMRLSRLVSDMLELSRLQSGKTSLTRSSFSLTPLLNQVHETYAVYAEDYQQSFVFDIPESLPDVTGNPDRTQQVLVALLDNAFKYSSEGGSVTLGAVVESDLVRITVRDTGIGISPEDLPHVFDRFYKADKAHHGRGTGLGLAIAYEIMKNLGEEMSVESTVGEGSAFSFTLHTA